VIKTLSFLLLQVRNADDPMGEQEVLSFARALGCPADRIAVTDLLSTAPTAATLGRADMVLLGGSGDYSAAGEGAWLDRALDALRAIHDSGKPAFASCWGFQAFARALGGRVIHDPRRAELGAIDMFLTDAGAADPVFGPLGGKFRALAGHEDVVVALPPGAVLLASSGRVENQAYRIAGRPIYCTQFHPELTREDFLGRVDTYPRYVEKIAGVPIDEFRATCEETPETNLLLPRFVRHVFGE
jgi:GMP synthase (glutamine-hydrolysing)